MFLERPTIPIACFNASCPPELCVCNDKLAPNVKSPTFLIFPVILCLSYIVIVTGCALSANVHGFILDLVTWTGAATIILNKFFSILVAGWLAEF